MKQERAVVFIGHGSRNNGANLEMEKLVAAYQAKHPDVQASIGYIELAKPFMGEALRQAAMNCKEVVAVPLLLFRAGHAKNDIPMAFNQAQDEFPDVKFFCSDVLGVHPGLAEVAYERARETGLLNDEDRGETAIVFLGRGASDPDANGDLCKQARIFQEGRGFSQVQPSFVGITEPRLEPTLALVARSRPKNLVVVPHILFSGTLMEKMQIIVDRFAAEYPWIRVSLSQSLGIHDTLLNVIDDRINQARRGELSLPCDTCRFRTPLPSQEEHVGGLKALLWSIRHTFTHNQAMPHEHAHRPLKKHVLVCGNVDCASKGSIRTILALRHGLKARGLLKEIAVTRTSCMGHCGEGPTMAVYPDGIWYRGVVASDAEDIIEEHLVKDKIVARLVDNIM
ncbi:MAG: NAD(P)H-dependent oxidoreductase subunit E [Leptospirales bacterium]|nr:NAD(P)H-dependent oxidoreductase subunit E [Leptospirales bacterium]